MLLICNKHSLFCGKDFVFIMIIEKMKKKIFQRKWRKSNMHNYTVAVNCFDMNKVTVGKYTYGGIEILDFDTSSKLEIGNFCSIAPNVFFCLGADHMINTISSYPFKVKVLGEKSEAISKGDIIISDDVWLGYGVKIMSGVKIGQGAVIAAGAVVTKDIPPYAIAGGVPAKVIKYRFSEEIIAELLKVDYSQLNEDMVREHIGDLYQNLTDVNQIVWMPRKV